MASIDADRDEASEDRPDAGKQPVAQARETRSQRLESRTWEVDHQADQKAPPPNLPLLKYF
jgi:hypothetical protein